MALLRAGEQVGRVLGNRYRLLRPIGTGASAHVYVAEDVRLHRRVALKVLHPALAEDKSFLLRFRAEAQTVAALRHRSIMRVYDWGEDGGDPYLVVELLEGGSLRTLLDSGYRLSVSQTAALGLDVASALTYAHARGLVHRDIKPANLLFDEEGRASIADFGLARALAEASWTEPTGTVVGTARYAAPEQLKGVALDGRADVYSMTLVLIEAVTGSVPFALDTVLGTFMARTGRPLEVPSELGPLVPVFQQAGAADPQERIDAATFAEAVAGVARRLRAPGPLPLPGLSTRGEAVELEGEATELAGRRRARGEEGLSVLAGDLSVAVPSPAQFPPATPLLPPTSVPQSRPAVPPPPAAPPTYVPPPAAPALSEVPPPPGVPPPAFPSAAFPSASLPRAHRRPSPRRWVRRFAVLVSALALAAAGVAAGLALTRPAPTYVVPALKGAGVARATTLLASEHLQLVVLGSQWGPMKKGSIVQQSPGAGTRLHARGSVSVTVSRGPQPVRVPDLATLDLAQATSVLRSSSLKLGAVRRHTSMTVEEGMVISWAHRGHAVLPGTAITVVISAGKPLETVPAAPAGTTLSQVEAELKGLGFHIAEVTAYSDGVPPGQVIALSPPPGERLVVGTTITVTVSLGPHMVTIPSSVIGLSVEQAGSMLNRLGVGVYGVHGDPLVPVSGTLPAVGTRVHYETSVILVTG